MDKTDFDSWLPEEVENKELKKDVKGQDIHPFTVFIKNKEKLEAFCSSIIQNGLSKYDNDENLTKFLAYSLFFSKKNRSSAKIDTSKEDLYYKDSINRLNVALSHLQDPMKVESLKKNVPKKEIWEILFYNELSICFAGLKNSSISKGYAEEAIEIIAQDERYKNFQNCISSRNNSKMEQYVRDFKSSNLYDLYLIAAFNKAESERRSHLLVEAERDFRIIKDFVEISGLSNFNYYSALLNLGILLADQSRGKESIELFDGILKNNHRRKKDDVRFWKAHLAKISSLIDQTEYELAEKVLKNFIAFNKDNYEIKKEHKVTHQGFDALNYYASCIIENAKNVHDPGDLEKKALKTSKKLLQDNVGEMQKRQQKQSEITAYKHLGNINELLKEKPEATKNYLMYLSKGSTADLKTFSKEEPINDWVESCDDLDALEKIFYLLYAQSDSKPKHVLDSVLKTLGKKIEKICTSRSYLNKIGKIIEITYEGIDNTGQRKIKKKIEEQLDKSKDDALESSGNGPKRLLSEEEIRCRLDFNEKKFDTVLFGKRNNVKHLAEIVILRRWNSFSPGLFRRDARGCLGGGYLVRVNKKILDIVDDDKVENIVIDPGYNFIQNFCGEGFSINDIDIIIVTHSHLDHCANLLPIMDLLFQINKRCKRWDGGTKCREPLKLKRITLCLSKGAYSKFSSYIKDWQKQLKDVIILENLPDNKWEPYTNKLKIEVYKTPHNDLGDVNAIGVKIVINNKLVESSIGFTGDTPYDSDLGGFFKHCDVLCAHIGSIKHQEIGYNEDIYHHNKDKPRKLEKSDQIDEVCKLYHGPRRANHLLLNGTRWLIDDFLKYNPNENPLVLVGEFGEELKYGLRTDLCKRLSLDKSVGCFPTDIGLCVALTANKKQKIRCNFCMQFCSSDHIRTFSCGSEDSIQYICQSCDVTLTDLQKQALLKNIINSK